MHLCDPRWMARVTVAGREVVFDGGAKSRDSGCSTSCSTRIRGSWGARRRFDEEYTSTTIEEGYEVITEANQAEATTMVCWVRGQSSQSVKKPGFNGAGL